MASTPHARSIPRVVLAMCAGALLMALVLPAVAAPLTTPPAHPKVAFVARNDNPFDAMAVGPVAGALGGIIAITPTGSLSAPAREALVAFAPEVVIIAGGTGAISTVTEQQIAEAGPWTVRRAFGAGRDQTAAEVAKILTELGVGRPLVTGTGQIVGDIHLGGTANVDTLTVQDSGHVANLNADLLDGLDSTAFRKVADPVDAATLGGLGADAFRKTADDVDADTFGGLAPSAYARAGHWEVEPNSTLLTANDHPRFGPAMGSVQGTAYDHWRVEHDGGILTARTFTMGCTSSGFGDTVLVLLTPDGTQLASNDDIVDGNFCSQISGERPAGTYIFRVRGFGNTDVPYYGLLVTPEPAAASAAVESQAASDGALDEKP